MDVAKNPLFQGRRIYATALGLFALVAILLYGRTLRGGFVVDDWWWAQKQIGHGWMANDHVPLFYRPVVSAIYWAVWNFAGPQPFAFHALNLVLLTLTALGIFSIVQALSVGRWVLSLLAGLLFVSNPGHPEAVCWAAGMTDTISTFFAIWGIWAFLRHFRTGQAIWLPVSCLFLGFALFAKESVVLAPVIACVLDGILPHRTLSGKRPLGAIVLALSLIPVYLAIRSRMVTGGVGGYGAIHWQVLPGVLVRWGGMALSNSSFLPIYRGIATASNLNIAFLVHDLSLAVLPAAMLIGLEKPVALRRWFRIPSAVFLIVMAVYALSSPFLPFLSVSLQLAPLLKPGLILALAFGAYLLWSEGGFRWLAKSATVLETHPIPSFGVLTILALIPMMQGPEIPVHAPILALWGVGLGLTWDRIGPDSRRLCQIALVSLVLWLMAIGPALHLPIGLDGQQSRFAYFPSCFAAIALAAFIRLIPLVRLWAGAAMLTCYFTLAWPAIDGWQRAGELSNLTVDVLRKVSDADRVVVLGCPATLDGALLFLGGLEEVPKVMFHSNLRPEVYLRMQFALHQDHWRVVRANDHSLWVGVEEVTQTRLNRVSVLPPTAPESASVTQMRGGYLIDLGKISSKTCILVIDGRGVTVLN